MITAERSLSRDGAKSILAEKHPELKIKASIDLNKEYYVFVAVEDDTRQDYIGPMYAVNKRTKKIEYYHPNADLENFSSACDRSLVEY